MCLKISTKKSSLYVHRLPFMLIPKAGNSSFRHKVIQVPSERRPPLERKAWLFLLFQAARFHHIPKIKLPETIKFNNPPCRRHTVRRTWPKRSEPTQIFRFCDTEEWRRICWLAGNGLRTQQSLLNIVYSEQTMKEHLSIFSVVPA